MPVFFAAASETATLTNVFTVTTGGVTTPTDPTTVTLTVTDPLGAATSYTYAGAQITRTGTGAYSKDVTVATAGTWQYVWAGTGTVPDANAGTFDVLDTQLGHLYATPERLRSRVGIPSSDTSADAELHGACFAASRWVENYCRRFFWRTASTEARVFQLPARYSDALELGAFCDLVSITSLAVDNDGDGVFEMTLASTGYELSPLAPAAGPEQRPYTSLRPITYWWPFWTSVNGLYSRYGRIQVTGVYGWPSVPAAVSEATRVVAAELFKAKDAPFGVASFGEYGAMRITEANPLAARLLKPYRHASALGGFA